MVYYYYFIIINCPRNLRTRLMSFRPLSCWFKLLFLISDVAAYFIFYQFFGLRVGTRTVLHIRDVDEQEICIVEG